MFQNLTRDQSAPLRGWAGSLATRSNFWPFLVIATLSLVSSGENPKNVKDCFSSTGSEFQSLRRNRFWHQILRSDARPFGSIWFHIRLILQRNIQGCHIQSQRVAKKHLSTSPSNDVIALSASPYFYPCNHRASYIEVSAWTL